MAICGDEVARKLGLTIGRDIAFLGFDNIEKDCYIDPPLASVDADADGLKGVNDTYGHEEPSYSRTRKI